jgi:hypothetical protein
MAMIKADPSNPQMNAILDCLSETEAKDMYQVAEELGSSYWTIYPYFRKLEEMGLVAPGPFRSNRKKTFTKTDLSRTPKIHIAGVDNPPVEIFKIAGGAAVARKHGTETGKLVDGFPYMILRLYSLASQVQAGHNFDKAQYQSIRKDMVTMRNRLENMILAANELLSHPVLSGDANQLVDTLMNDDNSPLSREKILDLIRECG